MLWVNHTRFSPLTHRSDSRVLITEGLPYIEMQMENDFKHCKAPNNNARMLQQNFKLNHIMKMEYTKYKRSTVQISYCWIIVTWGTGCMVSSLAFVRACVRMYYVRIPYICICICVCVYIYTYIRIYRQNYMPTKCYKYIPPRKTRKCLYYST